MRLTTILLTALFTTVVSADPILLPRAPCSCPSLDTGFYPLSTSSSTVGSLLHCLYPAVSRCQYSVTGGTLIKDRDSGLCPTVATGQTCPSTDLGGYALGPGSGVHDSILYCTYPTTTELNSQRYYCDYSSTTGVLSTDLDDGFCPVVADGCSASASSTTPVTTGPLISTTGPSSSLSSTSTIDSTPVTKPAGAGTLTSDPASSPTITSLSSGPAKTHPVVAVIFGSAVLFATLFIQVLL